MVETDGHDDDRRSAERFPVSLPVGIDRGFGVTRDVSVAGLYLVTEEALTVGDRLRLTLDAPDPDHPQDRSLFRVSVRGRVVRVERVGGGVGAGITLDEEGGRLTRVS